jgi:hypothetical protein
MLTLAWGAACWLSIVLFVLLFCCFTDWLIEREYDTPLVVRAGLLIGQLALAAIVAVWFVVWPQLRRMPDARLAGQVEKKLPHFDHRLISAVQLNRPGARVEGMSQELIALVTREAETAAGKVRFSRVADHRRLKYGMLVLLPVLLIVALPVLLWPDLSLALLARQALLPVEVPHTVFLESITGPVFPNDARIPLRYRVTGKWDRDTVGRVKLAQGTGTATYDLRFVETGTADGGEEFAIFEAARSSGDNHVFGVVADPNDVGTVSFTARLGDGRTRTPNEFMLVARPVIEAESIQAWVQLPEFCGIRPDGQRYELAQKGGDVEGIPGSRVRVEFRVQKPITGAWVNFFPEPGAAARLMMGVAPDAAAGTVPPMAMNLHSDGKTAEIVFDLREGFGSYQMGVVDEYGFANIPQPRRSLRIVPETAPEVKLLQDSFGREGDFGVVQDLPVVLGKAIRIPYYCSSKYGLGSKVKIYYRLVKKQASGDEPAEEEKWYPLTLSEKPANLKVDPYDVNKVGPFDVNMGVFQKMTWKEQVFYYAVPSSNPNERMGRTQGGGRYFLRTNGLLNHKGPITLKSGDQIEYFVEVFGADREPESAIPTARSESRVATVLDEKEFNDWRAQVREETRRLEQLQSHVIDRK